MSDPTRPAPSAAPTSWKDRKTFREKHEDAAVKIPWGKIAGWIVTSFFLLIFVGCTGGMVIYHFVHAYRNAPPPLPPTYKPIICADRQVLDYRNEDPPNGDLQIPVHEGCFGYEVYLPKVWAEVDGSGGVTPGDYIAVWCAGKGRPTVLLWWFDFNFGRSLTGCRDPGDEVLHFMVEGKVTPTTSNPGGRILFHMTRRNLSATQKLRSLFRSGP